MQVLHRHGQEDLLKFNLSIRMGQKGDYTWQKGDYTWQAGLSISEPADMLGIYPVSGSSLGNGQTTLSQ